MQPLSSSTSALSPSFTTYSSGSLADIAARVVEEFRQESASQFHDLYGALEEDQYQHDYPTILEEEEEDNDDDDDDDEVNKDDDDDEFEFPSVCVQSISADEIFCNGQIRPVFPVFGRTDLFFPGSCGDVEANCYSKARNPPSPPSSRVSLRSLMREERDPPAAASCSSSSESSDDLDRVPAETYCPWTPGSAARGSERWRKSVSTGSPSKRWSIRDLLPLRRSNSDGRMPSAFLTGGSSGKKRTDDERVLKAATTAEKSSFGGGDVVPVTAAEEEAGKGNEGEWRRPSYGRQDWVGFFANVNGLNSNLHPF